MPWQEHHTMDLRQEFVQLARHADRNVRELCRRFQISPKTGYKWLARYQTDGLAGLADQSRRPHASPAQTPAWIEARVLAARQQHPAWGGRKLRAWLRRQDSVLAPAQVPSASTITAILDRHGLLDPAEGRQRQRVQRFEHPQPNDLWQMDFMGHRPLGQGRVHPLCVLDDHSRYALGLLACANEQSPTVQAALTTLFRTYGLPWAILTDNGPPWAVPGQPQTLTRLEVWLLRVDVPLWHGRPSHPQTQGKVERWHATIAREVLRPYQYPDLVRCQAGLDHWRQCYNHERPHEALADGVPAARYRVSGRPFPEPLPPLDYATGSLLRTVSAKGTLSYRGQRFAVGEALAGELVALTPTTDAAVWTVCYGPHRVGQLDLRHPLD